MKTQLTDMQKRMYKDFSKDVVKELKKRGIIINYRSENPNGYSNYNLIDTKENKSFFRNYKEISTLNI